MIDSVLSLTHCLYAWRYYNHNNISSMMLIVFSACLSENRGIRVTHRRLLRYFTVCAQPENLRAFCSVLLLTNYFFNVQQQKMLPPQIQTANQALSCYLIRTSIFVKLLISVNPFYCWITSKSFLKFKPSISYCTTAASFHFFKTCIFSTQDSAC